MSAPALENKEITSFSIVNPNESTWATAAAGAVPEYLSSGNVTPGNVLGQLDYKSLRKSGGIQEGDMFTLTSAIGTQVGVHVYEPSPEAAIDVVVIFFHGNVRPTRYNPDIITPFLKCGATVVGRDLPGYDQSSFVPNTPGSVELAALANDQVFMNWVLEKYKSSRIVLCGRSIGTLAWTRHLSHPRVVGAIGIVPLQSMASLIRPQIQSKIWEVVAKVLESFSVIGYFESIFDALYPANCEVENLKDFKTTGLRVAKFNSGVSGKRVTLFPANEDSLVPEDAADELKTTLEAFNVDVKMQTLKGGHGALPTAEQFREAFESILV
uniref:AB hydrolase-1 domain-containing protein n=1 Tax=Bionectria ochroleuca TaxID=29856 RepID=A0A8H7TNB0_BIOOC